MVCDSSEHSRRNKWRLELKRIRRKMRPDAYNSEVAYICSYHCTYCATCAEQVSFVCRNCEGKVVRRPRRKERLIRFPLMLDSICEKTLVADLAHIDQRAMHTGGQEFLAQTCQRRRFRSAEHVRREREIELIDQTPFQQGAKKRRSAFACKPSHVVFVAQCCQHDWKIDVLCIA